MNTRIVSLAVLLILMGCSETETQSPAKQIISEIEPSDAGEGAPENQFGFWEAMEQGPDPFGSNAPRARLQTVNITDINESVEEPSMEQQSSQGSQQIAYSYGYGFQISSDKIEELQNSHIAMCESIAPNCRILRTSQANSDGWDGYGEIRLQVAATEAGSFGAGLSEPAEELGGELVSSVRDGEDLSEKIIDTEARLESRLVLRQKLTEILQQRRGSVAELVEAEKAVADVNEQIDASRSKLERYRNRIRFSDVRIEYEPYFGQTQLGFSRPVMTAFRSIGTTLGTTIAAIIYVITALIPITLVILALRWVLHRFGLRIRFWKNDLRQTESKA